MTAKRMGLSCDNCSKTATSYVNCHCRMVVCRRCYYKMHLSHALSHEHGVSKESV